MATRFAVASTSWNTPSTWDNGAVPVAGDTIYPNGFTVTIDTDISVDSLNNNISPVYLPNMNIPKMTGNTQPSGIVDSSGYAFSFFPYQAFDQTSTSYASNTNNTCWITYEYPSARLIKRYYLKSTVVSGYGQPASWIFEGWNGSSWDPLEIKTGMGTSTQTGYLSPVLTHTTLYSKYRLNVTVGSSVGFPISVSQFEMGESVGTIYGTGTGGSFTVPSSLVGTRNITFSNFSAGIFANSSAAVFTIAALTGSTVNVTNSTTNGYIIGGSSAVGGASSYPFSISGTATVVLNGNITGSTTTGSTLGDGSSGIGITNSANITINGNVYSGNANWSQGSHGIQIFSSTPTLNINGSIYGSPISSIGKAIVVSGGAPTINIVGLLTSNIGPCIITNSTVYLTIVGNIGYTNASSVTPITLAGASTLTLTGTLTAPPNAVGVSTSGSGAINITGALTAGTGGTNGACIASTGTGAINVPTGIITAGTNAVGISAPSSSLVTIGNSPLINTNGLIAVYAPRIRFYTGAQVEWTYQTSTGGVKILRNADSIIGMPSFTNVKIGQTYGPNDDIIGACIIPPASAVGVGIPVSAITPVDDPVPIIVGTLQLTGEDLLNAISTSSNVVAERLRNVSTVQTTGDQVTALS
jgi:hypothetical protein